MSFQLPLSGSRAAEACDLVHRELQSLSTPSLGITASSTGAVINVAGYIYFQLPLSGSRALRDHDIAHLGPPPFNSLSRDHLSVEPYCGHLNHAAFNSLSRDHGSHGGGGLPRCFGIRFQLPLSGSPHISQASRHQFMTMVPFNSLSRDHRNRIRFRLSVASASSLSTPSLGITVLPEVRRPRALGFQLPLSGSRTPQHRVVGPFLHFQLPLSGSQHIILQFLAV